MTHYDVLEVSEKASEEVIRMAYKALAKKYHPDVFIGNKLVAEEKMKRINTAFAVLSDSEKRRKYDLLLMSQRNPQNQSYYQATTTTYTHQTNTAPRNAPPKIANFFATIFWGIMLFSVLCCLLGAILPDDEPNQDLVAVAEPPSGTILSGSHTYSGNTITVSAASGASCIVKLKNFEGSTRLSFYVRAGDTVTVNVPREFLYVYFATGDIWYGNTYLFGEDTYYSMDDELLDFIDYSWEYTLYPVSSGNFSETPIDAEDF